MGWRTAAWQTCCCCRPRSRRQAGQRRRQQRRQRRSRSGGRPAMRPWTALTRSCAWRWARMGSPGQRMLRVRLPGGSLSSSPVPTLLPGTPPASAAQRRCRAPSPSRPSRPFTATPYAPARPPMRAEEAYLNFAVPASINRFLRSYQRDGIRFLMRWAAVHLSFLKAGASADVQLPARPALTLTCCTAYTGLSHSSKLHASPAARPPLVQAVRPRYRRNPWGRYGARQAPAALSQLQADPLGRQPGWSELCSRAHAATLPAAPRVQARRCRQSGSSLRYWARRATSTMRTCQSCRWAVRAGALSPGNRTLPFPGWLCPRAGQGRGSAWGWQGRQRA